TYRMGRVREIRRLWRRVRPRRSRTAPVGTFSPDGHEAPNRDRSPGQNGQFAFRAARPQARTLGETATAGPRQGIMTVAAIPIAQRVIGIDSRRFASIEKALVELITNCDDSYSRLEQGGAQVSGHVKVRYERHLSGAVLDVTDQAEGMSFERASAVLTYGGAHSPLSRGEGDGRGYFGRGLKQAVFGLGHGWIESVKDGRLTRIDLFRGTDGGFLFDDNGGDRPATEADHERLGIAKNGSRVTIVVDNPNATVSHYRTVIRAVADNFSLRDVLTRRRVDLVHLQGGREIECNEQVHFEEPAAILLIGPDQEEKFTFDDQDYAYSVTLKRSKGVELTMSGDDRTNGLVVVSGLAVLDCQVTSQAPG
ncbi:ATP-binding protein, partial [Actinophytocola sp.]|uniref:ATP-binding protein n=1 Tax=Actinophytocola sp. TaxID=1872138 RepID=UPI002D7F3E0F